ncbi:MBL fold metallo-hydrolase [Domibacillus epiphyticus]|uniref:MBL fold metallo-hydrolase n=1 Tax=Domibacillus epiphyticus TaxID=1714355 RepID=A0A1V2A4K9_9BACI|nr:MBL fold metallo-hydrolase [Domibacillus epiphyticus]OMP65916.1 MBL fold metallo-hydrolase [Domibacillus epiphyticus]
MGIETYENIIKITMPTPFPIGDVNTYLVKGDRLTLIDAGVNTIEARTALKAGLKEAGYKASDIEQVILTHHHPDHTGLLDDFHVDIYGHEYCANWLSHNQSFLDWRREFFHSLFREFGVPDEMMEIANNLEKTLKFSSKNSVLTQALKEGDELPALPGWRVYETPGHAQSHLVFYREKDGFLIAGDHVLKTVSSNPLIEPPSNDGGERAKSLLQYHDSLRKVMDLDIRYALTGHGNDIKSINPLIERRFERQHDRAMLVLSMLREKPMTIFDVCTKLFPEMYKKETGLTLSETAGQFDYLMERGDIHVYNVENGAAYFRG